MAKSNSILSLRGTHQGITHVKSKTYGTHIRAARGTHKKANVNDVFKTVAKQLIGANAPAKMIKDSIDPYRRDFYGGQMWQRLISIFKAQLKSKGQFDFKALGYFDIYHEYPLSRFTLVNVKSDFDRKKSSLTITLSYSKPVFKKSKSLNGYRFQVIGLFVNGNEIKTDKVESEIIPIAANKSILEFNLPVPESTSLALLCIKFEGCSNGQIYESRSAKAMAIVHAIQLE